MNSNTSPQKYSLLFQEYTVSIQDDFCVSSRDRLHTFVTEKEEVIALVLCSHHDVHVFFFSYASTTKMKHKLMNHNGFHEVSSYFV